ncbi:heavy metal transporter [Microbacterium sp. NC79]|uniref:heavy metal transporter n=1 Tax=Microbacterium sp. NC79 TaxID=2851009 RepID=UPI001C2C8178|nr:heavy metal transporter [Microbacterium sp. NC79]MBV0893787.1 heavy metal transporter [Microbacterium sp. NC79]
MSTKNRVRVTATPATATLPIRRPLTSEPLYARGLVRAQLRLALTCLIGFLLTAGAFTLVLFTVPALNDVVIAHVPLPWLLHAYGYYPLIVIFAVIYARGATKNENRYRALREGDV